MVVMKTLKYICIPSFTSMHCMVASVRSEEVVIGKSACGHFLLTVVVETMKYICTQSVISMCTIVGKFEK